VFVKICGCRRPEDVEAAAAAGASAVGLVLTPGFRRSLGREEAARVRAAAPPGLWVVGVFVDPDPRTVEEAVADLRLTAVQVHGRGAPPARGRVPVIRAWAPEAGPPPDDADYLLAEPGAESGGGRGRPWAWAALAGVRWPRPLLLAGGLTPENVAEALEAVRPFGVDVSSGVERDGVKDPERIAAFCGAVARWVRGAGGMGQGPGGRRP
jgi:phosphoribosylanthranilate isomerase